MSSHQLLHVPQDRRGSAGRTVVVASVMKSIMTLGFIALLVASVVLITHSGTELWGLLALVGALNVAAIGRVCSGARASALATLRAFDVAERSSSRGNTAALSS